MNSLEGWKSGVGEGKGRGPVIGTGDWKAKPRVGASAIRAYLRELTGTPLELFAANGSAIRIN